MPDKFRDIPSTNSLLEDSSFMKYFKNTSHKVVKESIRDAADIWRRKLKKNATLQFSREGFVEDIKNLVSKKNQKSLRRVINAQGVVLSTNLGRAILPSDAIESVKSVLGGYSNLEFDLQQGKRGYRYTHVRRILEKLTHAEGALIVNNNAAAVYLALNTLADGKEVIISRGELIEIGGSFRLPEVLLKSGAKLKEVGTTNITYLKDYEDAISEETSLLLKSHTSNYKIIGFTDHPSTEELVKLGKDKGIPTMEDLGSGLFIDLRPFGIPYEPTVQEVISTGIDIVTFSGDKLMGGPQAGIILGKKKYIELIEQNPLLRAVRVGKTIIAALEAVLRIYLYEEAPAQKFPSLSMVIRPMDSIKKDARKLAKGLKLYFKGSVEVIKEYSEVGGGSYPGVKLETLLVALSPQDMSAKGLAEKLRMNHPPIIPRISQDRLLLDPRTLSKEDLEEIIVFFRRMKDDEIRMTNDE